MLGAGPLSLKKSHVSSVTWIVPNFLGSLEGPFLMSISSSNATTIVKDQVASMLVQPLEKASVVLSSGPTVFNSSEPLRVPTISNTAPLAWVGENEEIPEANATFGEIELMPTNRKSIKTIIRVSNELIRMATIGVSAVLQARLVEDIKTKLDTALLTGDGADDSVTGLLNVDGLDQLDADPAKHDTILDALAHMSANEVTPNRLFMSGEDFFAIRKVKDTQGRYLLQPDITRAGAFMLQGVPVAATNKLEKGTAILANMPDVAVVRDIDPTVTVDTSRYLEYDQTAIRVATRYDLGVLRKEAVTIIKAA